MNHIYQHNMSLYSGFIKEKRGFSPACPTQYKEIRNIVQKE